MSLSQSISKIEAIGNICFRDSFQTDEIKLLRIRFDPGEYKVESLIKDHLEKFITK